MKLQNQSRISPKSLLILLVVWIFLAELCDMVILHHLPPLPPLTRSVIDATFLLVVLSPVYFLMYRPLVRAWEEGKRMHFALRQSEERYRSLVEDIDFGISLIGADHKILMTNRAQSRYYQKPAEAFIGRQCFREFAGKDHICARCPGVTAMAENRPVEVEGERVRADGTRWYAHIHAFPVFGPDGRPTGFIEVTEDVTERKRIERKLVENEERLNFALEATRDGLWDFNLTTGEVYFSPRWVEMLGYRPEEVAPEYYTWEKLLHPDDRDRVLEALTEHVEGRAATYEAEVRMKTEAGGWIWILTRGQVVRRDQQGKALRMIGTHTDITDRKRAEEEIRFLNHQLINLAEEERARLARDLHDEFGQILTTLQLGMETLRNMTRNMGKEAEGQYQRLIGLIALLGDHVRDVSAQLRPNILDNLGLVSTLQWHIEKFSVQVPDLRVELTVAGEARRLGRDMELALYRISQEALNNTAKHSRAEHAWIELEYGQDQVALTLRDDGLGFDPQQTRDAENGFKGIGLLGIRERVGALGGTLDIRSEPGRGTAIRVMLPA
ncbi:PAS domain-containing sensor histidine kinase [Desulfuromonas versatilis]|uniref:PAS domain-containing sensor histidine kinase n=1 Tax=Desulfuromonas versatilis TaxID=2802975 RepID=UPI001C84724D|nr:PAS domain-containing sensor histidine kinase [Desulfuromonas versatilis]